MEAKRFPFFIILFLLDLYLWFSVQKKVFKLKDCAKYLITFLYWLPLIFLIVLLLLSIVKPVRIWDNGFRTYAFGLVFIAYAAKIFTILFLFIADILRLFKHISRFVKHKKTGKPASPAGEKISRSKFIVNTGLIAGGVAFSGLLIGMLKWVSNFKIRRIIIPLKNLPDAFNNLRIVQISDLHLGSWSSKEPMKEAIELINSLNPDLVLFTGDLVNFSTSEAFEFEDILGQVHANFGIYAVLGNHDYGDYSNWDTPDDKQENMRQLYQLYKRLGWHLLNNENDILSINNEQLAILGVENWSKNTRFPQKGNIQKAKAGTENSSVKLLLSHDPTHWDQIISKNHKDINITFSGHTHGFQFGIEFKGFKWSPAQYMFKQWAGLYKNYEHSNFLYVNRGTGFIGYPGRVGILPEISLIVLKKENT